MKIFYLISVVRSKNVQCSNGYKEVMSEIECVAGSCLFKWWRQGEWMGVRSIFEMTVVAVAVAI